MVSGSGLGAIVAPPFPTYSKLFRQEPVAFLHARTFDTAKYSDISVRQNLS